MGVKIKNLPNFTGLPDDGDYFAVTDEAVTSKLNYKLLAQSIIENYSGTELAGQEQSAESAINALAGLLSQAQSDINSLIATLTVPDTAEAQFTGKFQNYSEGANPHFIKFGRFCMLYGVAKPTEYIPGSATTYQMFEIPEGFRPVSNLKHIMHGSYAKLWLFMIDPSGIASFSRLASGADYAQTAGAAEWLPFNATYICEAPPVVEEETGDGTVDQEGSENNG